MLTSGNELIEVLLLLSERAATMLRVCREDKYLLSLLTEEKRQHEEQLNAQESSNIPEFTIPIIPVKNPELEKRPRKLFDFMYSSSNARKQFKYPQYKPIRWQVPLEIKPVTQLPFDVRKNINKNPDGPIDHKSCHKNRKVTHISSDFALFIGVLIQEIIKSELERQFPDFKGYIYCKHNNPFTNKHGKEITIKIYDNKSHNLSTIINALNGKSRAAKILLERMYSVIMLDTLNVEKLPTKCSDVFIEDLGVWINPIDASTEFIYDDEAGYRNTLSPPSNGLPCVSVSISMCLKETGEPVIGVINQPFAKIGTSNRWSGRCTWGFACEEVNECGIPVAPYYQDFNNIRVCVVAPEEDACIKIKLTQQGFTPFCPVGNTYRILCVILGIAEGFILTKDISKYWDTCAGHAVLKSQGSSIWCFEDSFYRHQYEELVYYKQTSYDNDTCNKGGIIAARSVYDADIIVTSLKADSPENSDSEAGDTVTEDEVAYVSSLTSGGFDGSDTEAGEPCSELT